MRPINYLIRGVIPENRGFSIEKPSSCLLLNFSDKRQNTELFTEIKTPKYDCLNSENYFKNIEQ